MRTLFAIAALGLACVQASASPSVSTDSVRAYRAAITASERGERDHAVAIVDCVLMPKKVTIGVGSRSKNSSALREAIHQWNQWLPDQPLVFSEKAQPDILVSVLPSINSEGPDVQGEIHYHRQVRWGSAGAGYQVSGDIFIRSETEGRSMTQDEFVCVMSHELGHLLGLADDPDLDALMGPFVSGKPVVGPTRREASEVEAFRTDLVALRGRILSGTVLASRHGAIRARRRFNRKTRSS